MSRVPVNPRRRRWLAAGGATLGAAALAAWYKWPDEGILNPCRAALPSPLADHEVMRSAWAGLDPARVWDCHAHLVGIGDSGNGAWINPRMESRRYPFEYAQRLFFLNAACADAEPGHVDTAFVARLLSLIEGMRPGVKVMLLAFDHHVRPDGTVDLENSTFHIPDAYAAQVARAHPDYFEWAASIHPYRADSVAALESAKKLGARAVKWLPAAMGIDPSSPQCDPFYAALKRLDLPLIAHAGMERAVHGEGYQHLGNPLNFRRPLDHGVRVVIAHCASLGEDIDLDKGPNGPLVSSFSLFARLMGEARYEKLLYGDISAMTQLNRVGEALTTVIERTEWHPRLLNGSDYPLPGVMPLFSLEYMAEKRYITAEAARVLSEVRRHNALLFDFALKRNLRVNGKSFSASVFETRGFFDRPAPAG
ncbi:MAG: amidohydrolase family protein [Burkholderiales bacterium]